jgi:hypothetical protein
MQNTAPRGRRAYGGDELLEAGTLSESRARATEILVDDADRCKADRARRVGQRVLAALALGVLYDLTGGGLAHVHDCASVQMLSGDLRVHRDDPL